jgi:hypothetical protein
VSTGCGLVRVAVPKGMQPSAEFDRRLTQRFCVAARLPPTMARYWSSAGFAPGAASARSALKPAWVGTMVEPTPRVGGCHLCIE